MKKLFAIILVFLSTSFVLFAQVDIEKSTEKVIIDGEKFYLHTVKSGQTLYSICKAYDVKERKVRKANPELTDNIKLDELIKIPICEEISVDGEYIVYSVKSGDTLYSLCKKYGISEDDFYLLNDKLKRNKSIKVGQEIKFPTIEESISINPDRDTINFYYHAVEKGETLYGLARTYNVKKEEIIEANSDFDGTNISIGQLLRIPKHTNIALTDQQLLIDSLANINFINDSIVIDSVNICDTSLWYTHGKEFKIVILLPFEIDGNMRSLYNQEVGNKEQRLYLITEKVVAFYSGCLVALDNFKYDDVKIDVHVFDIGRNNTVIEDLINNGKLENADLIIGPAFRSQIDYINTNLQDSTVAYIVPFVDDDEILKKYPQNISLKPSIDLVVEHVANYAAYNPNDNYIIIQGKSPRQIEYAALFKEQMIETLGSEDNVRTIVFNGTDLVSLKSMVEKERENVFILPFADEASAMQIFTKLFPFKKQEITLIGPKKIIEFSSIDPLYYSKVKFAYFSSNDIHFSDTATYHMLQTYKYRFLIEPSDLSFVAYDAVSFFVDKLIKHGDGFVECIDETETYNGLSGDMQFVSKPNYSPQSYTNNSVYIHSLQEDFSIELVYPLPDESGVIDDEDSE